MIEFKKGNLLKSEAEALVNPVNCVGVMGAGLALGFKKKHPGMFKAYQAACHVHEVLPGRMHVFVIDSPDNPRYIINFPTKRHWKNSSQMEYIESGLQDLIRRVRELEIHSVAVPALGCGLGGLDWAPVRDRMLTAFAELPTVQWLIYEPC